MCCCSQQDLSSGGAPQGSLLGENYSHKLFSPWGICCCFPVVGDKEKVCCAAREEKMLGSFWLMAEAWFGHKLENLSLYEHS